MSENEEKKFSPGETFKRALALHLSGKLDEARTLYRQILDMQPCHFDALLNLGLIHQHYGNMSEAVQLISAAVKENPESALAQYSQGNLQQDLKQYDAAIASYRRAIAIKSDYAEAHNNLGNVLLKLKRHDEALASYDRAIEINPRLSEAFNNRGVVLKKEKRYTDAAGSFDRAVTLKPDYAEAWYNLGCTRQNLKDPAGSLQCYDRALALRPDYIEALNNRGVALKDLGRYAEALEIYDQVIAQKPDHAEAWNNRGIALKDLNRYPESLQCYDHAIALQPDFAEAWNNRGVTLQEIRRHTEALESFRKAIAMKPDYAEAHLNEGFCCLQTGIFDTGWQKYEWRWQAEYSGLTPPAFRRPRWTGAQNLRGKTILLHAEQGLGDIIQFSRYVKKLMELGAKVILGIQPQLKSLLASLPWPVQIITPGEKMPEFDYHCPLLSLPLVFKTTLDTIPADIPYLYADKDHVRLWREKLPPKKSLRVGLVWSGTTRHRNDRNRSIPLSLVQPLAELPAGFYSLQKELRDSDREILAATSITHFGEELVDFSDTAAAMALMDLVISVDTSVAHLAGAMGKPLWLLLPYISDFRWLLDREDSPWYPTARLYRQPELGDWPSVIARVRKELEKRLEQ